MKEITAIDIIAGQKLRILRKQKGLTQKDLSKALSVSSQQIQKYESGKNRIPAASLCYMAKILECSLTYFLDS